VQYAHESSRNLHETGRGHVRLRLMQKVWLQMPLFVLLLPARLLLELSKGLSSAAAVVPPPTESYSRIEGTKITSKEISNP